jgi:hypothetical protein
VTTFRERITELSGLPSASASFRTNLSAITGNGDRVYVSIFSEDASISIADDEASISISSDDGLLSLSSDDATISLSSDDATLTINDNDVTSCL